jgi:glycosyltransferase involved in cell wall biosynthesis
VSDENLRQLRVLHIVSAGGVAPLLQQSLFMPLLTRLPKARVTAQVVCLSPGAVPAAVLRQQGVPVHDVALSRKGFSVGAFRDLARAAKAFRPDVIQAWGHTAQIVSSFVRARCESKPKLVWSAANTVPLARGAGFIDRRKLKLAAKRAAKADRIVYTSEAGASQHRRVGFPDGGHATVSPGVDATRYRTDAAMRRKVREQLQIPPKAFVIGMLAPFQPEYDHATLLKAAGDLIKTNPDLTILLAGHGVQKGNASLMALVGGGALGTRTHLLGEWSDVTSLFNACDVVCSSAQTDSARMTLVMAMLCGVPCVATGMGAQGEVIGHHGVAVEPGSPAAFVKGVTRIMQLAPEKRAQMVQGARKHALQEFVYVRALQKYLQLYFDLVGRDSLATEIVPAPTTAMEVPAAPELAAATPVVDVPPAQKAKAPVIAEMADPDSLEAKVAEQAPEALPKWRIEREQKRADQDAQKAKAPVIAEMADPDSLEAKVAEQAPEALPKWRIEQEQKRAEQEAQKAPTTNTEGDVLEIFESSLATSDASGSGTPDRAHTVEDEFGELLSPEMLEAAAPATQRTPTTQPRPKSEAASPAVKLDASDRMRAAAREELKRAAAAMSAPEKKPTTPPPSTSQSDFQLELLPDEPLKQASG